MHSLARIITRNPQDAFAVSEYLRSEGYTVETVSPGEFRITPAELELDLTRCGRSEAVDRAQALVASHRGGASVQTEAPAVSEPPQPRKTKTPIAYDIVGRPVAFAEEEPGRRQNPDRTSRALALIFSRVTAPVRDFQRRRAERRSLKLKAEQVRRRQQEVARERARQEMERRRAEAERAERQRQEQIAAEQQAEEERARAALVRAAGIAAASEAARQQELEPAAVEEPAGQEQAEPVLAENPVLQHVPASGLKPARPFGLRQRSSSIVTSGKAVAIGCAAGILVVLGLVANANRRPASPLSPGALMLNTLVKQEVPFGPVTITPPAAPEPSPVVTRKILPAAGPSHGKSGAGRRRGTQANPDDVVIRHPQPPSPNLQSTASTAKLKQHSDTD
jgi:hypothetical protein